MTGMSRLFTVAVALAVLIACSLILLHAFRGHSQNGTFSYDGKTYDCQQVIDSFESSQGPGRYPQSVIDYCVSEKTGGQ
jgi:hypothetical protein